ncbi:thiol-disulfide oxidoreductase DCC family protein [Aestuariivivens sediminis]|uniref:thiol-disulfide oxidoreductase DCC family protein n=1 Tax=Aestuariivivens sediminis TaxID=2913557 RepID=UPI001F5A21EB|nr:DCC1-like thiol-disulfide oxidoreductase family protein [Aestuariivivens sediminis]
MTILPQNNKLILFDGVCNLCNGAVRYVIRHDKKEFFMFAAMQSNAGQDLINTYIIDTRKTDSIILYTPKQGITYKSTAVLKIMSKLGFPINLSVIFFIVPEFIRNWIYDFVARNRYKWFGKQETCMVPTPKLKRRFLE